MNLNTSQVLLLYVMAIGICVEATNLPWIESAGDGTVPNILRLSIWEKRLGSPGADIKFATGAFIAESFMIISVCSIGLVACADRKPRPKPTWPKDPPPAA